MSRAIWKYPLTGPEVLLQVPQAGFMEPGIVRSVAWQHDNPTLWIEVETDKPPQPRLFRVKATGERFDAGTELIGQYVGSAISDDLVFHVYEIPHPDEEPR